MSNFTARQGDLLITKINELPKGAKKLQTKIIVRGEATGHHHSLKGGDVFLKDDLMYLVLKETGQITHQEHEIIELKPGIYGVVRQREYTSDQMTKLVVD